MNILDINLEEYDLIPVYEEFYADYLTPVLVLRKLLEENKNVFLLESANNTGTKGRYSFLGFGPEYEIITDQNGITKIYDRNHKVLKETSEDPNSVINSILEQLRSPIIEDLPPFTGGLVGYFSYDYYKYQEPTLKFNNPDLYNFNDVHLMLFNNLIVFDHFKDKVIIISNAFTNNFKENEKLARKQIKEIVEILKKPITDQPVSKVTSEFIRTFNEEEYEKVIEKAKYYIVEGDIFQVVPSNRIKGKIDGSLLQTYRVIRSDNPSPYMYFLKMGDHEIAGTSPETLVRLTNKIVSTFPIAGTRPRGKTTKEDRQLEKELLNDQKELAEHNMLVDLGRNDIGKISKSGSVKVEDYQAIQKYSKIMHITSKVTGEIKDELKAVDALGSILPAGTLSGAPKIRACEIIEELEVERRGPYGGAIGYLGFNGNMDMCIAIRSAFKYKDDVFVQSGGGIVYDSQPIKEFEETVNKAEAVIEAIKKAERLDHDFNSR